MGQRTDTMNVKLKNRVDFQRAKATLNGLEKIIEIELAVNKYENIVRLICGCNNIYCKIF